MRDREGLGKPEISMYIGQLLSKGLFRTLRPFNSEQWIFRVLCKSYVFGGLEGLHFGCVVSIRAGLEVYLKVEGDVIYL